MILYFYFYAGAGPLWYEREGARSGGTAAPEKLRGSMPVRADDVPAQAQSVAEKAPAQAQPVADNASAQAREEAPSAQIPAHDASPQTRTGAETPQAQTDTDDILPEPEEGITKEEAIRRVREAAPRIIETYRGMTEIFEPYFGPLHREETADPELPEMDAEDLQELYEAVGEFAEIYDADGILRLLQQTDGYSVPADDRKKLEQIRKCVNSSDWSALLEVL
ncbi:MAG: hypothetical protein IJQ21_02610 [Lachnospiraceae bacterium]|nr:hypothetical protein [Lachnospiraceae bacterium]